MPLTHKDGTAYIPHSRIFLLVIFSHHVGALVSGQDCDILVFNLFREVSQPKVVEAAGLTMEQSLSLGNLV